jgi:hypothetical protein
MGVVMMVTLLGAEPHVAESYVKETKGSHAKITYMNDLLKTHVKSVNNNTEEGDLWRSQDPGSGDADLRVQNIETHMHTL